MDLRLITALLTTFRRRRIFASKRDVYRTIVTAMLASLPMIAAWDYGGVLPYTQWYLAAAVLGTVLIGLPIWIEGLWRLGNRSNTGIAPQFQIPLLLVGIIAIGSIQTISWPASVSKWLSPATHAAYTDWIPDSMVTELQTASADTRQEASGHSLSRLDPMVATHPLSTGRSIRDSHPLSVAPWVTRRAMYAPAMFAILVLVATILFRNPNRAKLFMLLTGLFGSVLGFLGIADAMTTGADDRWVTVSTLAAAPFASFVNRNNAGCYLNLTLACSLGYLVWRHSAAVATARHQRGYRRNYDTGDQSRLEKTIRKLVAAAENSPIALLSILITLAAIVSCGSRGAVLGTAAGLFGIVMMRIGNASTKTITRIAIVLFVALVVGIVSLTQTAGSRIATLWNADLSNDGRLEHWSDTMTAIAPFMPMGSGLGTYRFAYLPYQQHSSMNWFLNADSLPIEWLLEGGLWLLPMIMIGIGIVVRMMIELARTNTTPQSHAVIVCGTFMACSQIVSQSFDFGMLLPANLMTCAMITAAVVATFAAHRTRQKKKSEKHQAATDKNNIIDPVSHSPNTEVVQFRHLHRAAGKVGRGSVWEGDFHEPTTSIATPSAGPESPTSPVSGQGDANQMPTKQTSITPSLLRSLSPLLSKLLAPISPLVPLFLVAALVVACHDAQVDAITDFQARQLNLVSVEASLNALPLQESRPDGTQPTSNDGHPTRHPLDAHGALTRATSLVHEDQLAAALIVKRTKPEEAKSTYAEATPESRRAIFHLREITGIGFPRRALLPGQSDDRLRKARRLAVEALMASPLSDEARRRLISLDFLDDSFTSSTDELLRQSAQLRCNTPSVLLPVAELATVYPGIDAAAPVWTRLIELDPTQLKQAWKWLALIGETDQLTNCIPPRLTVYVNAIEKLPLLPTQKLQLQSRAQELAEELSQVPLAQQHAVDLFALGRLAVSKDDWRSAQAYFQQAADADPTQTEWRYQLAIAAEKNGDRETTQAAIERCLLQQPDNKMFQEKARKLNDSRRK